MCNRIILGLFLATIVTQTQAQTNPLWHEEKVKNYLPHMTSPEVRDLLTRKGNLMGTGCFFLCHQRGRKSSLSFSAKHTNSEELSI